MRNKNFPANRDGQAITVSGVTPFTDGQNAEDIVIDNRGSVDVFVLLGGATAAASTSLSTRVPVGAIMSFAKGGATHISVAVASGTPNLVVHFGEGC